MLENGKMIKGTLTFLNGTEYVGEFKNGKENGKGTKKLSDGNIYVGEYKNGMRHGMGINTIPEKNSFTKAAGEWKNDKMYEGQAIKYFNDGSNIKLKWLKGKLTFDRK